jgi:hypothetical protein
MGRGGLGNGGGRYGLESGDNTRSRRRKLRANRGFDGEQLERGEPRTGTGGWPGGQEGETPGTWDDSQLYVQVFSDPTEPGIPGLQQVQAQERQEHPRSRHQSQRHGHSHRSRHHHDSSSQGHRSRSHSHTRSRSQRRSHSRHRSRSRLSIHSRSHSRAWDHHEHKHHHHSRR